MSALPGRRAIAACMVCGSRELRWPAASDGVALGQAQNLDQRVCQHGHVGVPLLFDDPVDWQAFVGSLGPPSMDSTDS